MHAEFIVTGLQSTYSLALRLYLEYNHRGNSWRLSGENREIFVNVTDMLFLGNRQTAVVYPDHSRNPRTHNIRFNSSCSSHQIFPLRLFRNFFGPLSGSPEWRVNTRGTIVEKMIEDNDRWNHSILY